MAKSYVVTGALATPYAQDGSRPYLYEGTAWPDDLREGETERFLDLELISEVGAPAEAEKPAAKKAAASKSESK